MDKPLFSYHVTFVGRVAGQDKQCAITFHTAEEACAAIDALALLGVYAMAGVTRNKD